MRLESKSEGPEATQISQIMRISQISPDSCGDSLAILTIVGRGPRLSLWSEFSDLATGSRSDTALDRNIRRAQESCRPITEQHVRPVAVQTPDAENRAIILERPLLH